MSMANVRLGRLDSMNGPANYSFPSVKAAIKFADTEHALHEKRPVIVRNPDGRVVKRYGTKSKPRAHQAREGKPLRKLHNA